MRYLVPAADVHARLDQVPIPGVPGIEPSRKSPVREGLTEAHRHMDRLCEPVVDARTRFPLQRAPDHVRSIVACPVVYLAQPAARRCALAAENWLCTWKRRVRPSRVQTWHARVGCFRVIAVSQTGTGLRPGIRCHSDLVCQMRRLHATEDRAMALGTSRCILARCRISRFGRGLRLSLACVSPGHNDRRPLTPSSAGASNKWSRSDLGQQDDSPSSQGAS